MLVPCEERFPDINLIAVSFSNCKLVSIGPRFFPKVKKLYIENKSSDNDKTIE